MVQNFRKVILLGEEALWTFGGRGVITKSDYIYFFFFGGGGGGGAFLNILGLFKVKIQNRISLDSKISNIFGYA